MQGRPKRRRPELGHAVRPVSVRPSSHGGSSIRAHFVRPIHGSDPILQSPLPQIAFVGRSNVGKSSSINALLGMKGMAKSSATPGKTIAINFFEVNGDRYVVDLPGYGYARISAKAAEKMRKQILWYLEGTEARPDLVILVVDVRVGATEHDLDLLAVALRAGRSVLVLANKIDKLSGNERPKALSSLMRSLGDTPMVPFSAKTGEGRAEVLKVVLEVRRG